MILDDDEKFSDAQAIVATAASENTIDLGVANSNQGEISVACRVGTAFTAAGAATLAITLQDSANNIAFADIAGAGAVVPVASLTAGQQIDIKVPHQRLSAGIRRYLRLNYTVATGPMTAGTMNAFLVLNPPSKGA